MRCRGVAKLDSDLGLSADFDYFDYEKRRGVYIFAEYSKDTDVGALIEEMKGLVLFPNVTPVGSIYRRCDGVWLAFRDEVAEWFLSGLCSTVMSGGYPPQFEYAFAMLVDRFAGEMGEEEAANRAAFALAQLYAAKAVGEQKPSELGYEADGISEPSAERLSLYAGRLALYEIDGDVEIPHVLCSHAFRRLVAVTDDEAAKQLDGRSVQNAIEYLCRKRGAKGYPHPARAEVAYDIAALVEAGRLAFVDEPPDAFPHT